MRLAYFVIHWFINGEWFDAAFICVLIRCKSNNKLLIWYMQPVLTINLTFQLHSTVRQIDVVFPIKLLMCHSVFMPASGVLHEFNWFRLIFRDYLQTTQQHKPAKVNYDEQIPWRPLILIGYLVAKTFLTSGFLRSMWNLLNWLFYMLHIPLRFCTASVCFSFFYSSLLLSIAKVKQVKSSQFAARVCY